MSEFKTVEGKQAAHAQDGEWLQPSENPFGHGCCDCGLFHQVRYRIVDQDGNVVVPLDRCTDEELSLQLQFTRDEANTAALRKSMANCSGGFQDVLDIIDAESEGDDKVCYFMGIDIRLFTQEYLVKILKYVNSVSPYRINGLTK